MPLVIYFAIGAVTCNIAYSTSTAVSLATIITILVVLGSRTCSRSKNSVANYSRTTNCANASARSSPTAYWSGTKAINIACTASYSSATISAVLVRKIACTCNIPTISTKSFRADAIVHSTSVINAANSDSVRAGT
jgi:hypothetical protein